MTFVELMSKDRKGHPGPADHAVQDAQRASERVTETIERLRQYLVRAETGVALWTQTR